LLNGGENVVEKPNPTDIEAVAEKLKNGKLKITGSNPKSNPNRQHENNTGKADPRIEAKDHSK